MDPTTPAAKELSQQAGQAVSQHAPVVFSAWWVIGLVALTALISWAIGRLIALPGLRRVRRWLALARVVLWALVTFDVVFTVSRAVTEHWLVLGVVVLAVLALVGMDWLRNVAAGLALAFEGHFQVGDLVRYRDIEGELVEFSARAVILRADDGTLHQVPNQRFSDESVTHLEADGEAACEIVVSLPTGVSPERAVRLAQQAAFLTPLASPRHRPDVFLDVGADDAGVRLHIRGFAFDPAYRDHFKSDVVARVHSLLRTERGVGSQVG